MSGYDFFIFLFALQFPLICFGQSSPAEKEFIQINGNVRAQQVLQYRNNQSQPFKYGHQIQAAANLKVLQIQLPFQFIYLDQDFKYQHPFRRFRMAPRYKGLQLYLGNQYHNFSSYSLNGIPVNGLGVAIEKAGLFKITALYGKISQSGTTHSDNEHSGSDRKIFGSKIEYQKNQDRYRLILLQIIDPLEARKDLPQPTRNLVAEFDLDKQLSDKFHFRGTINGSNHRLLMKKDFPVSNNFLVNNFYSSIGYAMNCQLNWKAPNISTGLQFEQIDPSFRSLGLLYQRFDARSFTLQSNASWPSKKLNVNGRWGLETDNLDHQKLKTTSRIVGSGNLSWQSPSGWTLRFAGSTFAQYVAPHPDLTESVYDLNINQDTTRLAQINRHGNLSLQHNKKHHQDVSVKKSFSFQLNLQQAQNTNGQDFSTHQLRIENRWETRKIRYAVFFNYSRQNHQIHIQDALSPGIKIASLASNKTSWNFQSSLNTPLNNSASCSFSQMLNCSLPITEKQKIQGSLMAFFRPDKKNSLFRLNSRIAYQYQF